MESHYIHDAVNPLDQRPFRVNIGMIGDGTKGYYLQLSISTTLVTSETRLRELRAAIDAALPPIARTETTPATEQAEEVK